ncbi:MAG: glycosyltransferase family 39 protein [Deltaproteobacteria bacterium]|nr:glycosyltransferase family 39 protein [Deltaproteobacteria bacterium]
MLALFGLALCMRLLWVAFLLSKHPALVKYPAVDGAFYHQWAQEILSNTGAAHQAFFAHPLYPHVMAALYKVFAVDPLVVILFQCVLGSVGCLLMVTLVRLLFSEAAAWWAGGLLAVFWPAVANAGLLESVEVGNFCLLAALLAWTWTLKSKRVWSTAMLAGAFLGLAALCRGNLLLLAPAFAFAGLAKGVGRGSAMVLCLCAGLALPLAAVGVRNRVVTGQWMFLTGHSGVALYSGFTPGNTTGTYQPPAFVRPEPRYEQQDFHTEAERRIGHALTAADSSRYWRQQAWATIVAQPGTAARAAVNKLGLTLAAYEVADNYSLPYLQSLLLPAWFPLPGFGLLLVAAVIGMGAAWHRRTELAWVYAGVLFYVGTLLLFFVSSRMRAPLWILLLPFAGAGVVYARECWADLPWRGLVMRFAPALGLLCVVQGMAPASMRSRDRSQALAMHGISLERAGRFVEALDREERALRLDGGNAFLLVNAGQLRLRLNDVAAGQRLCARALALRGNSAPAHACLGVAEARQGNLEQARAHLLQAAALDSKDISTKLNLAIVRGRSGEEKEAQALLDELAQEAPNDPAVQSVLRALRAGR